MNITAAVVEEQGGPFVLRERELDELRDDEVLVEVVASGICHTDLICRDQWIPVPLPAVLGHEGAGVVRAAGSAVTAVSVGDRVAMSYDSCGACPRCTTGHAAYCDEFFAYNFAGRSFFGQSSFATHSVAHERNVVRLDDSIPLEIAAPFGCGIQTGAGAVLNVLRPERDHVLAIFGAGAVGLAGLLAARASGCRSIVAVDLRESRLELARELGATHVVDASREDPVEAIRELGGADRALEATGAPQAVRAAVDCLAPVGVCGIVGAPALGTEVSLDVNHVMTAGRVVRGIVEGEAVPQEFLPRLVDLWRRGAFPVDRFITHYDFDDIDRAAHDAESGAVVKPVLRMH
ncbi:MAG TPA: NAD(P)-dependent alcohol dehydrogenase [Gaiellaceae bacterium]|nr:NAD(P)-dependent alcohol dehydrogenase [Gaiellaceae bacterium]